MRKSPNPTAVAAAVAAAALLTAVPAAAHPFLDPEAGFRLPATGAHASTPVHHLDAPRPGPLATIVGDIVVVEDDGTIDQAGALDAARVLPAFYSVAPDSFDFVSMFRASTYPTEVPFFAFAGLVRIETAGLGRAVGRDRNGVLGIRTERLVSTQNMGDLRHYGASPDSALAHFGNLEFTGLEILASEVLHGFGCWGDVDQVVPGASLLGRSGHWGYGLAAGASVMEGARWQDNGDGTFTSLAALDGISELDEYLLGLRPAASVPPMFVIDSPDGTPFPVPGLTVQGTRFDVTIQDFIAQNGPRVPDASASRKSFRTGFVLVVPPGTPPDPADLAYLESFRGLWETWFEQETEGLGTMDTRIPLVPAAADLRSIVAGNPPLTVTFLDLSEGTILARRWRFGAGVAGSRAVEPVRTFRRPGVRAVTLIVRGPNGESQRTTTLHVGGFSTVASHDFEDGTAGWSVSPLDDAQTGRWERADPEGTSSLGVPVQPEDDATAGGGLCWVTGASAGAAALDNSVHGGTTTLRTPAYDLSACTDPYVSYSRWYSNDLGSHPAEDELVVAVSADGGTTWAALETVHRSEPRFRRAQFRLADHVAVGPDVRFRFVASDLGGRSLVEAAIDDFEILDAPAPGTGPVRAGVGTPSTAGDPTAAPNPFSRRTLVRWEQPTPGPVSVTVLDVRGRVVRTLLRESAARAGARSAVWDGRADDGARVAAGTFIVRIDAGGAVRTRRIVFLGR